jgi:hypothetical protein
LAVDEELLDELDELLDEPEEPDDPEVPLDPDEDELLSEVLPEPPSDPPSDFPDVLLPSLAAPFCAPDPCLLAESARESVR